MTRVYLDSSLLLRAILDKSELRALAIHSLEKLRGSSYDVIIPQIVIGESFSQIVSKSKTLELDVQVNVRGLLEWVQKLIPNPGSCMPPGTKQICELAQEISQNENWIDMCDSLIVSHALLDPDSHYFLTTDKEIHRSLVILNKMNELKSSGVRNHDLEITDSI